MEIKLYNTTNSNNTINKELTDELTYNIQFTDTANVISPVVRLKDEQLVKRNYAYIPNFKRYYFIRDISSKPNRITTLELEVDVLESFKEDILESYGTVGRHLGANKYYDGGSYPSEERKTHTIYKSDVTPEFEETVLMTLIGG